MPWKKNVILGTHTLKHKRLQITGDVEHAERSKYNRHSNVQAGRSRTQDTTGLTKDEELTSQRAQQKATSKQLNTLHRPKHTFEGYTPRHAEWASGA